MGSMYSDDQYSMLKAWQSQQVYYSNIEMSFSQLEHSLILHEIYLEVLELSLCLLYVSEDEKQKNKVN